MRNREGHLVEIPGDQLGRKLHLEYMSPRLDDGKKPRNPAQPNAKRGGLVRREYRLVPKDYDPSRKLMTFVCGNEQMAAQTEERILALNLPLEVGSIAKRCMVTGPARAILKIFGVKRHGEGRTTMIKLAKEINKKEPLVASGLSKKINRTRQTETVADEPLSGLTFEAESSCKALQLALPSTALLVYINPARCSHSNLEAHS